MTREQLDAIRKNVDFNDVSIHDVIPLLAEVERLTAEVEMLRGIGCVEEGDGPCGACRKCAFVRGVAAMREAAAQKVTSYNIVVVGPAGRAFPVLESPLQTLADKLRALPDPEDR